MKRLVPFIFLTFLMTLCGLPCVGYTPQGEEGARARKKTNEEPPKRTPNTSKRRDNRTRASARNTNKESGGEINAAAKQPLITLAVSVSPPDSTVLVNGQQFASRDQYGRRVSDLKPGVYTVVASKEGFVEQTQSITLTQGKSEYLSLTLSPVKGSINIKPSVTDTKIVVVNKDKNIFVGRYADSITDLKVEPGHYQIEITKDGYRPTTREVTVKPGESLYLEPPLEGEQVTAVRTPERERPNFTPDAATTVETALEGKLIIVSLRGRSGDTTAAIGSLNVEVNPGGRQFNHGNVSGMLTGFPCQVDFVRIENVAEFSFVEPPGINNQWGRVVVRVRPKDFQRPIRFSINWKSLQVQPADSGKSNFTGTNAPVRFEPAVMLKKVLPIYPTPARAAHRTGLVVVTVDIDAQGNVVSAKALEGPALLRQAGESAARQWKFNPARRDGQPVAATQTIQFNFQL